MKPRNDELASEMYMTPNEDGKHLFTREDIANKAGVSRGALNRMVIKGGWNQKFNKIIRKHLEEKRIEEIELPIKEKAKGELEEKIAELNVDEDKYSEIMHLTAKGRKIISELLDLKLHAIRGEPSGKYTIEEVQHLAPSDPLLGKLLTVTFAKESEYEGTKQKDVDPIDDMTTEDLATQIEQLRQIRLDYPKTPRLEN